MMVAPQSMCMHETTFIPLISDEGFLQMLLFGTKLEPISRRTAIFASYFYGPNLIQNNSIKTEIKYTSH